ncbi:MAG: hypothetical protein A2Z14_13350 [Chloroflexi bacterium RBG_16_48_8]|nr:MAG: hypothetical protein A2Z14_13350 [Chloroflexi bacterium RBG_16_48_8]
MLQGTIDLLDVGMFNVALPSIQQEFTLQVKVLSVALVVRYLAHIGMMPTCGLIGDRLEKKLTLLAGMATFFLGAVTCLFSPSLTWLMAGRILLGMGGGILPLSMAIISDHFSTGQRGRSFGITTSPAETIVGPPRGGLVIKHFMRFKFNLMLTSRKIDDSKGRLLTASMLLVRIGSLAIIHYSITLSQEE